MIPLAAPPANPTGPRFLPRRRWFPSLLMAGLLGLCCQLACAAEPDKPVKDAAGKTLENPFPRRIPGIELEGGIEWLNTAGPISLKEDLKGKVVVLDFWTFCCINCIHILPDLKYLEEKYPNELVVIGVHSAKFDNEKETGNIRKAILRYEIEHPVINDANMTIWRKYETSSWPTLVLIDPEGFVCGIVRGEGNRAILDRAIEEVIAYHKAKGTLDERPVRFDLERLSAPDRPLKFPGKILADKQGGRLFVSDSNHNRIVITGLDGTLIDTIGTGAIGRQDGSYDAATFDHPQGMVLHGNTLYVADTENHLIRAVDLDKKQVTTLAGTGYQNHNRDEGGALLDTALNSPWDLYILHDVLYVAMAGPHQIWSHKLGSKTIQNYAGSGREDITNGSLAASALAQPSGIASDGNVLFVVDSEGSAVRRITTKAGNNLAQPVGQVTTLVGTSDLPRGRSLFEFGDIDGKGKAVRLQHPLGIAYKDGVLFVADSYNHKIKKIDVAKMTAETWLGTGEVGDTLDPVKLSEPAGLAVVDDTLFIADTNNHRILSVDIGTKKASVLEIKGLKPPVAPEAQQEDDASGNPGIAVAPQKAVAGKPLALQADFNIPAGFKRNDLVPVSWKVIPQGDQQVFAADVVGKKQKGSATDTSASVEIPLASAGTATVKIVLTYGFCREGEGGLCKVEQKVWTVPLTVAADGEAAPIQLPAK